MLEEFMELLGFLRDLLNVFDLSLHEPKSFLALSNLIWSG
jgi:hypothetical protein